MVLLYWKISIQIVCLTITRLCRMQTVAMNLGAETMSAVQVGRDMEGCEGKSKMCYIINRWCESHSQPSFAIWLNQCKAQIATTSKEKFWTLVINIKEPWFLWSLIYESDREEIKERQSCRHWVARPPFRTWNNSFFCEIAIEDTVLLVMSIEAITGNSDCS